MADNVLVSNAPASSNTDIPVRTTETADGKHLQHMRLDLGSGSAESVAAGTLPVSASALPLPSGAATAAAQLPDGHNVTVDNAAGAAAVNIQDGGNSITIDAASLPLPSGAATEATLSTLNTKIPAQGQAAMAASVPVVIANNQSNVPTNIAQMNGTTVSMNTGVRDAGTQRVTIATNDVVPASQSGTWNIGTVTNITNQGQIADNAAFTDGTTRLNMAGFIFDEVAGTALTENDGAAARIDSKRAQVFTLEDATTRGRRATVNASNQLEVNANRTFATINHGSKSFATAGVAEALGSSTTTTQIDIVANSTNTGVIWIGGSGVSAGNGRPLVAGQMYSVSVSNLATVFGVSTVNGEGVSFTRFV